MACAWTLNRNRHKHKRRQCPHHLVYRRRAVDPVVTHPACDRQCVTHKTITISIVTSITWMYRMAMSTTTCLRRMFNRQIFHHRTTAMAARVYIVARFVVQRVFIKQHKLDPLVQQCLNQWLPQPHNGIQMLALLPPMRVTTIHNHTFHHAITRTLQRCHINSNLYRTR